ncbi:MAG TPA: hypothetical protein VJU86_05540 [Pyrinomonadaceae bacterium]|nr:hypothetical protein [Pyrinomonadaceae bacterium]
MSIFSKRNLLVGLAAVVIVVGAVAAIWGVPKIRHRNTSVKSTVSSYLLDERGAVNGLLLANNDQLHFSPETGTIVATQIKIGDEVEATGHAGSQTSYGREIRVEQISANGRTIQEVRGGKPGKHGKDHGSRNHADRERGPGPSNTEAPVGRGTEAPTETASPQPADPNVKSTNVVAPATTVAEPTPETLKVSGTIRTHLVNGHGDVDGLILSGGEQVRFSPKVGKLVVSAGQGPTAQVSVEGAVVRNERGTVIRPTYITVGNQTIAVSR